MLIPTHLLIHHCQHQPCIHPPPSIHTLPPSPTTRTVPTPPTLRPPAVAFDDIAEGEGVAVGY